MNGLFKVFFCGDWNYKHETAGSSCRRFYIRIDMDTKPPPVSCYNGFRNKFKHKEKRGSRL